MNGKPDDLPEHISEENIGHLWQAVCSECDTSKTFDGRKDDVLLGMMGFRKDHWKCDEIPVSGTI